MSVNVNRRPVKPSPNQSQEWQGSLDKGLNDGCRIFSATTLISSFPRLRLFHELYRRSFLYIPAQ